MSTLKKVLALTLALAMILSVSAFAGSYKADTYKDAASIDKDCEDSIELLYALDIMQGDAQGNFRPNDTITRAEVAKMIYVIKNYGNDDKAVTYQDAKIFSDVSATAWYAGYVNYCGVTKLIQGRGNGTFGPNDPVTTAAAAKMLLTAIGYDAEQRGYTGANWDKNVLSDAAIVGLLDDYKYTTIGNAPRQWVAVMFANALTNAYTYKTMVAIPGNGLLNESAAIKGNEIITLGEKYYNLATYTGYLYATEDAYIDTTDKKDDKNKAVYLADEDMAIFAKKASDFIEVDNPGLGYMDLGQQYRVIYNKKTDAVYSAKATGKSAVGDSTVYDLTYDIARGTSSNEAKNRYEFTAGEFTAKFSANKVNELYVAKKSNTVLRERTVTSLVDLAGQKLTDDVRLIDKDGDGAIDYVIYKDYEYAQVTKVAEHKTYGDYFTADDVAGNALKVDGFKAINSNNDTTQWYLDDVVNTDAEIEKGNVLKIVFNPDNGKYDVEVMAVETGVAYEKRSSKGIHTLGGEDYEVAENGWKTANEGVLVASNLKDEMDLVAEDGLVIMVKPVDSDYDNLDDINAQLVMVTDVYQDVYDNLNGRFYIDYMTIDGETHEEVRLNTTKTNAVAYADVKRFVNNNQRLFVLRETGDQVYLIKLTSENAKATLDYSSSLLDGYTEETGKADTDKNTFTVDGVTDYINNENKFFVSYKKSETGSMKFAVVTMDELGEGTQENAFIQGLYTTKRTIDTYQAGHIYLGVLNMKQATGYLYTTSGDTWSEDSDQDTFVLGDVVFSDGTTAESIVVEYGADKSDEILANSLYSYTYDKVQGDKVYTLTLVNEMSQAENPANKFFNRVDLFPGENTGMSDKYEIVTVTGKTVIAKFAGVPDEEVTVNGDTVVVLKQLTWEPKTTYGDNSHDDALILNEEKIGFVSFSDLIAEEGNEYVNYIAGGEDDTYTYYSDYIYVGDVDGVDMLYVIVHAVSKDANH